MLHPPGLRPARSAPDAQRGLERRPQRRGGGKRVAGLVFQPLRPALCPAAGKAGCGGGGTLPQRGPAGGPGGGQGLVRRLVYPGLLCRRGSPGRRGPAGFHRPELGGHECLRLSPPGGEGSGSGPGPAGGPAGEAGETAGPALLPPGAEPRLYCGLWRGLPGKRRAIHPWGSVACHGGPAPGPGRAGL